MGLAIGVLGPLTVRRDGATLTVDSPKQRSVLVRLALSDGPVSADALVDTLWGERQPASARTSLRAHVSRLRATLGGERPAVVHEAAGYRFDIAVELDADRFLADVRAASDARDAGRTSEAAEGFAVALARWRGDVLAGFRYEPFTQPAIARLEALRLDAVEARLAIALEDGGEVTADLDALVLEHPLRERFHELLIRALYRDGRTADALSAYRRARETFVSELGLEPSPRLEELHRAILSGDTAATAGPDHSPGPSAGRGVPLRTQALWTTLVDAIEVPPLADRDRCLLLLARGASSRRGGQVVVSQRAYAAAARLATALDEPRLLATSALGLAGPPEDTLEGDPLDVALLERAILRLPDDDPAVARLRARLGVHLIDLGDRRRGGELLTAAATAARRCEDAAGLAYALRATHRSWFDPADIDRRLQLDEELLDLGTRTGDDTILAWGHRWRGIDVLELGRLDEAAGHLDVLEAVGTGEDELFHRWGVTIRRAGLALLREPLQKAEADVLGALALTEQVRSNLTSMAAFLALWTCRYLQGRSAELHEAVVTLDQHHPMTRSVLPFLLREVGRIDELRPRFEELAEDGFRALLEADPIRVVRLAALAQLAECAVTLDDRRSASVLYELLAPHPDHLVAIGPGITAMGTVQHALGRLAIALGDRELAAGHYDAALERCATSGAVNLLPRTQLAYAALLRVGGPRERGKAEDLEHDAGRLIAAHGLGVPPDLEPAR